MTRATDLAIQAEIAEEASILFATGNAPTWADGKEMATCRMIRAMDDGEAPDWAAELAFV